MLELVIKGITHTPWWVYPLFALSIYIGIKASKTSIASTEKLFHAPTIFLIISVESLHSNISLDWFVTGIFLTALLIGILCGWLQAAHQSLKFDKEKKLMRIPGTWNVLIFILIIFAIKYSLGFELALDPELIHNTWFEIAFVGITAWCTGLIWGKTLCYVKRMYVDPHTDLERL